VGLGARQPLELAGCCREDLRISKNKNAPLIVYPEDSGGSRVATHSAGVDEDGTSTCSAWKDTVALVILVLRLSATRSDLQEQLSVL
jgi:hypothetical protein